MDRKRDYYEDVAVFSSGWEVFWFASLLIGLAALPFLVKTNYYVYMANYMAIHVLVALGLNLLTGYTGQISLGHAGFFAVGAYGTVALMAKAGVPFVLALPAAGFAAALLGFLLGLPALRLEGPYLSIATLGFGITVTKIIGKLEIFGGRQGMHAPELVIGPWNLSTDRQLYFLIISITVVAALAARNIMKTRVGRAFRAVREAEVAAGAIGVDVSRVKTMAFAVSAFYTGIAGGLFAFVLRFIEPELFNLMMSILFLAMVVVGGLGSILGSVAGAILISWLNLTLGNILELPYFGDWLKELSRSFFSITGVSNIQFIVYGSIMVGIMVFEPLGIYGFWLRTKKYWKTWPF